MDYLSEQIQNNGFEVEFNKEEKEMTVYKDDEPLENGTISVRKNKYVILILRT